MSITNIFDLTEVAVPLEPTKESFFSETVVNWAGLKSDCVTQTYFVKIKVCLLKKNCVNFIRKAVKLR